MRLEWNEIYLKLLSKISKEFNIRDCKIFGKHRLGLYFHYTMEKTGTLYLDLPSTSWYKRTNHNALLLT